MYYLYSSTNNISKTYYPIGQMSPKLFDGNISDSNFVYYLENCKEYTIDIKKPIREVEIFIRKYGIRARRLIYDEDCLEEVVKEYIKTHSIF